MAFYECHIWDDQQYANCSAMTSKCEFLQKKQIPKVENLVHRHHPTAVLGGASWTIDAFEIRHTLSQYPP